MNISFDNQSTESIIDSIKNQLEGRNLGKIVNFACVDGKDIAIQIKKLGTSTLKFARSDNGDCANFTLSEEKIALAHKAFKDEVTQKIMKVVQQAGGKVS